MRRLLYSQLAEEDLIKLSDEAVRRDVARALVAMEHEQLLPRGYSVQPLNDDGWLVVTVPILGPGQEHPHSFPQGEPFDPDDDDDSSLRQPVYYIVFRPLTAYDSIRLGYGGHDFLIDGVCDGDELRRRCIEGWY